MVEPEQRDFELKLGRAHRHLKDFGDRANAFVDYIAGTLVEEPDPQAPGYYGGWVTGVEPEADPFSLLIGDCLQCMRTALDQLAFELAASFTVPLPDQVAKLSEFPIFGDAGGNGHANFHAVHGKGSKRGSPINSSGLAKTQGMHPDAQKIIEGLQPYKRGQAYTTDPLWVLHELNRIDKHRLLHATVGFAGGIFFEPGAMKNVKFAPTGAIQAIPGEIHGRTQVVRWTIQPIDPDQPIQTGCRAELKLGFADSVPLVAGEEVLEILVRLSKYIVRDVVPPLRRFLK